MKRKEELKEAFDIPVAERKYLNETNQINKKNILLSLSFLLLLFSISVLRFSKNSIQTPLIINNIQNDNNQDESILGHLPYNEISKEKLVFIEPNIEVHIDMSESLLKMREDARKDGIYLVFLSGYRSINLQKDIFYSLKSQRSCPTSL